MKAHDLEREAGGYRCTVCTLHWKSKPVSECSGLVVYLDRPEGLLTYWELEKKGLRPIDRWKPDAYYRDRRSLIELYDEQRILLNQIAPCYDCGVTYRKEDLRYSFSLGGDYLVCRPCRRKRDDRPPYHICLVCGAKRGSRLFMDRYRGYGVRTFRFCCDECEESFLALPVSEAIPYIQQACLRYYGKKHYIYTLEESDTALIRYVGRTKHPTRRKQQHMHYAHDETYTEAMQQYNALPEETRVIVPRPCYQEGYWGRDLIDRGAHPVFRIVEEVADGPLGAEREVRWILHLIQQGEALLNSPALDEGIVEYVKSSPINFLTDDLSLEVIHSLGWSLANGAQHMILVRLYYLGEVFANPDWLEKPQEQRLFPKRDKSIARSLHV